MNSHPDESQHKPSVPPSPSIPSQWAYNPYESQYQPPAPSQGMGQPVYAPPASASSARATFDFQKLLQSYKAVLTRPSVATFDAELPGANWQAVLFGVGVLSLAMMVVVVIANLVSASSSSSANSLTVPAALGVFLVFFVTFFLYTGFLHLVAKLFGGSGSYLTYAYAISLALVPLDVVSAVVFIIPVLGALVLFAAGIFELFLLVLATQSAHRLTVGKSVAVALIPVVVSFIIYCLFFAVLITLLLAAVRGAS